MRTSRWLAPLLAAALLAVPTAASAQEAEPVEPVEETTPTIDPADVLAGWLSAIREVVGVLTVAPSEGEDGDDTGDAELTDEQRAALEELAAMLRDGISARATILRLEEETEDGTEEEQTEGDEDADEAGSKGEIVSTVARCAPRGRDGELVDGARNHGWWVSTTARGGTVTLAVPQVDTSGETPVVGETVDVAFDLSTLEGAEALCAAIATIREADALLAELGEQEPTAKEQRAAEREERKAERAEERAESKAERDRAKAERAEERAERKAGRAGGRPAGGDDTEG
jgi:hypothetical protein